MKKCWKKYILKKIRKKSPFIFFPLICLWQTRYFFLLVDRLSLVSFPLTWKRLFVKKWNPRQQICAKYFKKLRFYKRKLLLDALPIHIIMFCTIPFQEGESLVMFRMCGLQKSRPFLIGSWAFIKNRQKKHQIEIQGCLMPKPGCPSSITFPCTRP